MAPRPKGGTKHAVYDQFAFGDHGVVASMRAPKGSYSGLDAVVYADGNLGPRCGLAEITGESIPAGTLAGLGYYSLAGSTIPDAWFAIGTAVYRDPAAPVALTGALASTPTKQLSAQPIGAGVFVTSYGDKTYRITSTAVTAVASSPGGQIITLFGERLLVAGTAANPNRVWYTDPLPADGASATFTALGYFDVGRGAAIVGLWVIRNLVYIALDDGSWWVYSGVPGVSDSLRLAYTGQSAPAGPASGAVVGANSVWFVARDEHFPSYFNGSTVNTFDDQDTGGRLYGPDTAQPLLPAVSVLPISRRGDMLLLAGCGLVGEERVSLLLREERWSRHSVFPCVAVPTPGGGGLVLMSDGGGAASPRFFLWQATGFDRPPDNSVTRPIIDPGLGLVSAEVDLPEYISSDASEMLVRSVTIDLRAYDRDPLPTLLRAPGEVGNYIATADNAVLDIVGDLDLRAEVALDDWSPTSAQVIVAKWISTGDQRSYRLCVTATGALELEVSVDGIATLTRTSTADLSALAPGARRHVRVTLDVNNGAAGHDVIFYTSPTGAVWSQLGSTVTTAGVIALFSSTSELSVGASTAGAARLLVGNVYSVEVRAGIAGTIAANPDFTVQAAGASSFIDGSGRTWTIVTSGAVNADLRTDATDDEERPVNGVVCTVTATRLRGEPAGVDTVRSAKQTRPFTIDMGSSDGLPARVKHYFGEQGLGAGYSVRLEQIRGVAVEQVAVEYEEMAATP